MNKLTTLQNKVLTYIKLIIKSKGHQPSIKEMADYFGVYPTAILSHLRLMEKKGYIKMTGKARAINILK
jgi:SOS-response transcriptional repressor LexA